MKTRIYSWISLALILMVLAPFNAYGAEADLSVSAFPIATPGGAPPNGSPTSGSISLNQAIVIVKKNFIIPSKFSEFNSSYEAYQGQTQVWRLEWINKEQNQGGFMAAVDVNSGEIVSMNRWERQDNAVNRIPAITIEQARQSGQKLINHLLPAKSAALVADETRTLIPINSYGQSLYNIRWTRVFQGIPVGSDNASVDIDMQTGEPVAYNLSWHQIALPDPKGVIGSEKAAQGFNRENMLALQYFIPQAFRPVSAGSKSAARQPRLVYALHNSSGGAIDAITGAPFSSRMVSYDMAGGMAENLKFAMDSSSMQVTALTPEEQTEVDTAANLISQEQAIQAVFKWIKLPDAYVLQSSNLERRNSEDGTRYWSLSWSRSPQQGASYGYLGAQVDAATGELTSFNLTDEGPISAPTKISRDEARQLAEAFIKQIQAQRWPEIKLDEQSDDSWNGPSGWSFNYYRLVNGIPYYNNSVNITVNTSKEITNYNLNWSKAQFPPVQDVIDSARANRVFLQAAPMKLRYVFTTADSGKMESRLVYIPDIKNGLYMLDAKSGGLLNREGEAPVPAARALRFNDIKGHYAEREISLLGQAGMMGEYGDSFHPEEKITLRSLLTAMLCAKEGIYDRSSRLTDEELINRCQQEGWISDTPKLEAQVSREALAALMLHYLKIEYLTGVQGIYRVPYQDAKSMSTQTYATAAINWGLGIIKADGKKFDGNHPVSRAEAAAALVHMLSIKTRQ